MRLRRALPFRLRKISEDDRSYGLPFKWRACGSGGGHIVRHECQTALDSIQAALGGLPGAGRRANPPGARFDADLSTEGHGLSVRSVTFL